MVRATSFFVPVPVPSRNFVSPKSSGGFLVSRECLLLFLLALPAVS